MAILVQREGKGGGADAAKSVAASWRGAHNPAGGGGAGAAYSLLAKQKRQGAMFLRHQV